MVWLSHHVATTLQRRRLGHHSQNVSSEVPHFTESAHKVAHRYPCKDVLCTVPVLLRDWTTPRLSICPCVRTTPHSLYWDVLGI